MVSIICTSYNHGDYVTEALDSVIQQNYENLELIIIDNGSRDKSASYINQWLVRHQEKVKARAFFHDVTINYCRSFNRALSTANGKYIIDLSADDVLLQGHLTNAVEVLEKEAATIYFSNAVLVDSTGRALRTFYPIKPDGRTSVQVASGDVYRQVVERNFLCAPTLVFRADALVREGGYDESLTYEDFDIIVRMARNYAFTFNDHIGVKKRLLKSSFSAQQYKVSASRMLPSTLKVCRKIHSMNRNQEENRALAFRIMHETKHALASANFVVADGLLDLAREMGVSGLKYCFFKIWAKFRWDFSRIYSRLMLR